AMTRELSKELKATERAAAAAAKAAEKAKPSVSQLGDAAGKAGSGAAKLAGALDLVAPGAGSAARAVADLADVGEVASSAATGLGLSLGPLVAVAGGVALALAGLSYAHDQAAAAAEAQRERLEQLRRASEEAIGDWRDLSSSILDSQTRYEVASGAIDDLTAKHRAEARALAAAQSAAEHSAAAQVKAAEDVLRHAEDRGKGLREEQLELARAREQQEKTIATSQKARDELARAQAAERAAADTDARREAGEKAKAAAMKRAAEAARELASAQEHLLATELAIDAQQAEANKAESERLKRGLALVDRLQQLDRAARDASVAQLDGLERVQAEREAALEDLLAAEREELASHEDNERAKAAITERYARLRAATETRYDDAAAEHRRANTLEAASFASSTAAQLSELLATEAESQSESDRAAAAETFKWSKGFASAEAAINTYLAATAALAQGGPLGIIQAAVVTGLGLVEQAKIRQEQPRFSDTPGVSRMGTGGGSVQLAPGDYFAASQSREDLARQAAPASPVVRVVAETHYRHQSFNRFIRDNLRSLGPLGQAFRAGKRVGHREERS
ncbi:MAG: hypothetical protein FJ102_23525, partial [Deltaproteobacteria bacterium]|nr:hypothetical protein [Deltaproteobacteria bacterium]